MGSCEASGCRGYGEGLTWITLQMDPVHDPSSQWATPDTTRAKPIPICRGACSAVSMDVATHVATLNVPTSGSPHDKLDGEPQPIAFNKASKLLSSEFSRGERVRYRVVARNGPQVPSVAVMGCSVGCGLLVG